MLLSARQRHIVRQGDVPAAGEDIRAQAQRIVESDMGLQALSLENLR